MRLTAMITMSVLVGAAAEAEVGGEHVTVYLFDRAGLDNVVRLQAKSLASQMFAAVGLRVDWRTGRLPAKQEGAIEVELVTNTPSSLLPGALAYTRPYEGVHIRAFWDRIQRRSSPYRVLAHVMVHEITHTLEGVARHSEQGVMKACWDEADFGVMGVKPLPFAPEDVEIIHLGLKARSSGTMVMAAHPEMTAAVVPIRGN